MWEETPPAIAPSTPGAHGSAGERPGREAGQAGDEVRSEGALPALRAAPPAPPVLPAGPGSGRCEQGVMVGPLQAVSFPVIPRGHGVLVNKPHPAALCSCPHLTHLLDAAF